jgi:P2-related tail formation protein
MHVMANGKRLSPHPSLPESRALFLAEFAKLPASYKQLQGPERYPVALSPQLARFQEHTVARLRARYGSITASA